MIGNKHNTFPIGCKKTVVVILSEAKKLLTQQIAKVVCLRIVFIDNILRY